MPVGPSMGSPLQSPDNPESPGIARPSGLLGADQSREPGGEPTEGSMPEPNRQLTQVISRVRQMETQIDQFAESYPGAAAQLRKVKDLLRRALQQIVATGGGPGQEPASPRMLG
jgi:hypothetical protein